MKSLLLLPVSIWIQILLLARSSTGFGNLKFRSLPRGINDKVLSSPLSSSSLMATQRETMFPVLSRIEGMYWEGECRYVNAELSPASFVLTGGVRYDLKVQEDDDGEDGICSLTSFLVFPNGKSREVQMMGKRGSLQRPSMRLDPVADDGPVYMVVTELLPDTILLNEVEKATGRIIMTSTISLVTDPTDAAGEVRELIQTSHEVGSAKAEIPIEGHQVWRLKKVDISGKASP